MAHKYVQHKSPKTWNKDIKSRKLQTLSFKLVKLPKAIISKIMFNNEHLAQGFHDSVYNMLFIAAEKFDEGACHICSLISECI